jgi:hypothetical protein
MYAQTHSYTFHGALNPEKQKTIQRELLDLKIQQVTFHYKSEISAGQILFTVPETNQTGENEPNWSPVDIKKILISYGLEPGEFNSLKE